jgi:parallel beta-helix repeat protein
MTKFASFASDVRVTALLCCSAAVLLTACGGGLADAAQQNETAAVTYDSAADQGGAALGAVVPAVDPTAPPATASADSSAATAVEQAPPLSETEIAAAVQADDATRLLASTVAVAAATPSIYHLYVATTGSDSNPGTQAKPFKTIQRAANLAKASTTVHVAAGTYTGNVLTKVHGTSTARIRYVSDTKWGAKIIGTGTEFMWRNDGNYTDVVGFDISGPGRGGIMNMGSYTLMQGNHVHHLKVSGGCTGAGGAGIVNANYAASDGDIIGNVINDIGVPGSCSGVQGIYSSNPGGKIMNNIVYRVSAWGIHLWHAADRVTIANNTVFANGTASMGGGIVMGVGDSPGGRTMTNTKVVNNLVYNNASFGIYQYCPGAACLGSGNVVSNNLVYGSSKPIVMKAGSATATISANPRFVNYQANGTGNYRLLSTSPAINKGTATSAPTTDIDNIARPRGAAHDIGAYENY